MKYRITAASLAVAATTLFTPNAEAKNILVIIVDDLSVDKVGAYAADFAGYAPDYLPDTPTIDGLAAAGLRFTRAWATPLCSPTRASLQTGVFPFRHEVGTALPEAGPSSAGVDPNNFNMFAETFAGFGYETGFFGKWHLGTEDANGAVGVPALGNFTVEPHPARAGWDRYFGILGGYPGAGRSFTDWHRIGWTMNDVGHSVDESNHLTSRTSRVATDWINDRNGEWLAIVSFSAPHSPDTGSSSWEYGDEIGASWRSTTELACLATQNCTNEAAAVYQALAEHVDLELEDLLNDIDPEKMEDTLIFFMGDNGTPVAVQESVFNQVGRGKGTTYENGIRVPLIVADGDTWLNNVSGSILSPGRVVEAGVNTMDIFQTAHNEALLISAAFVDSLTFSDCFDTTDVFCGRGRQYGYSETFTTSGGNISTAKIAVRYGHDKLVAEYCPALGGCMAEEFFDTSTDFFELSPQAWVGIRADRLRDYFTNLHTPVLTSWAYDGGTLVGFCGAPCP